MYAIKNDCQRGSPCVEAVTGDRGDESHHEREREVRNAMTEEKRTDEEEQRKDTWGICTRRAGKLHSARSPLYRRLR